MRQYFLIILAFLLPSPAFAEDLKIDAGGGIAWMQEQKFYLATGRVRIIRGDATSWSNLARAYYDDDPGTITRVELEQNVRFIRGDTEIEGDFAEIFTDRNDVRVTGERPRLEDGDIVISADDFLHYEGESGRVTAQGNALLARDQYKVFARKMLGILETKTDREASQLREVFFWEDVRGDNGDSDPEKRLYVEGDEGYYQAQQSWIRVCSNARVQRGNDIMRGDCAHYDLESEDFHFLQQADLTTPLTTLHTQQTTPEEVTKPTNNRTQLRLKTKN